MKLFKQITAIILTITLFTFTLTGCSTKYRATLFLDHIGDADPFNQPAVDGLNYCVNAYGIDAFTKEATDDYDFEEFFTNVSSKNDLVIGLGYKIAGHIVDSAETHPDINFVAIDCSYETDYPNLIGISYRVQESSFLVGYIAGMTTTTNKLGFVGGMETDNIYAFDYGYRAGVLYAAKQRGIEITVESVYINDFANSDLGYETAKNLYSSGCDIVFHAAGASGIGVINAARDTSNFVIGVDVDQSYLAPQYVLTSALKDIEATVILTISEYTKNTVYKGGTKYIGLYEGGVGIPSENPLVDTDVMQRTQELKELIINGDIVPPATLEQYNSYVDSLK